MDFLFFLSFLLMFVSALALVIGLIKPSVVLRKFPLKEKSRYHVLMIFGGAIMLFFSLCLIVATPSEESADSSAQAEQKSEEAEARAKEKEKAEAKAKAKAEEEAKAKEEEKAQKEAEEKAKAEAEAKAKAEKEAKAKAEAKKKEEEAKAKAKAEEKAKAEAEKKAKQEIAKNYLATVEALAKSQGISVQTGGVKKLGDDYYRASCVIGNDADVYVEASNGVISYVNIQCSLDESSGSYVAIALGGLNEGAELTTNFVETITGDEFLQTFLTNGSASGEFETSSYSGNAMMEGYSNSVTVSLNHK